jgi:chromosomal replication initiation ATPase DnaA
LANRIARDEHVDNANPLVIYGAHDCGKSHLLDAIFYLNMEVSKNHNEWLSSDAFQAIIDKCNQDTNKLTNFKQISLILIDDIDSVDDKVGGAFIAEVLEKLINDSKQICVACTELPNENTSSALANLYSKGKCFELKI